MHEVVTTSTHEAGVRFIDDKWLNGDPVWVVYRGPDEVWLSTVKPQSVFNYAHGDMIAVAGEDPYLYGYRFVPRDQMFTSREAAENECARRNASRAA